jgi:hypothetical protein
MAINKRLIKSNDEAAPTSPYSFNTVIYSGDGSSSNEITGVGFQPDFVWIKERTSTSGHQIADSVRGAGYIIGSDSLGAEFYATNRINSFDSDGFTVGSAGGVNAITDDYVAWCWKAAGYDNTFNVLENGSTTSSATAAGAGITAGSNTSNWSVSANRDAGFSIVKWTYGNSINTVGHGLDNIPKLILIKTLDKVADWQIYSSEIGNTFKLIFDTDTALSTTRWDSTDPTSDVFTLRDIGMEGDLVAYCFAEVAGFSKFGSYIGNYGTAVSVDLGFEPAFIMIKNTNTAGPGWNMYDNKRLDSTSGYNIFANSSNAEADYSSLFEMTATGFTVTGVNTNTNFNNDTFIYMAFANQF